MTGRAACQAGGLTVSYHIRSVPSLSTIEMSPGYGFTMSKKKLVSSCPEIFFAAKGEAWRNLVLGMGARGKGQRLECTPKVRQQVKGPATLNGGERCWCPDNSILVN
jgi:hypothetical protein